MLPRYSKIWPCSPMFATFFLAHSRVLCKLRQNVSLLDSWLVEITENWSGWEGKRLSAIFFKTTAIFCSTDFFVCLHWTRACPDRLMFPGQSSTLCEHGGVPTHPSFLQQSVRLVTNYFFVLFHTQQKTNLLLFSGYEEISKVWRLPRSNQEIYCPG